VRFAFADPPYLGSAARHYEDHPDHAVYDTIEGHAALIERLIVEFPDGWALSMASKNLRDLLPLCPDDARVMAWCKPWTRFFLHVNPAWAWEPVIVVGGRKRGKDKPTVRDFLIASAPHRAGRGFTGKKPDEFSWWVFEVLGMEPGDELVDIFPGSGAVGRAFETFQMQMRWTKDAATEPLGLEVEA
jgi:hypothetical protein